jgi:hypothetical protein
MPDLEKRIADWRQQMLAAGIKAPVPLDELESHLRDDVEEQMKSGTSVQHAFENAIQRLGQATALECEFEKVGETTGAPERIKTVMLTLAGIPNHYVNETMNTSSLNIEPRWATYLKATAFLLPAICLWLLSIVFLIPKLQQICADAGGGPLPGVLRVMMAGTEHGLMICAGIIVALVMLEWRFDKWPRYRRATVGCGTFLLNAAVLVSIFMMVVTAILMAPALMHHVK